MKLDKLLAEIGKRKGGELHHLIHRSNILFRYDVNNLILVNRATHYNIHFTPGFADAFYTQEQKDFILNNRNKSIKDYLLSNCLTMDEFLKIKEKELKKYYAI